MTGMGLYIRKALMAALVGVWAVSPAWAVTDTYRQTFDSMTDGASIEGEDAWVVSAGDPDDALVESGETSTGSGKALKLAGTQGSVDVSRPASYGSLSPTWVEYVVKASMGADQRDVPEEGIAAVNFSSTGNIMVSD